MIKGEVYRVKYTTLTKLIIINCFHIVKGYSLSAPVHPVHLASTVILIHELLPVRIHHPLHPAKVIIQELRPKALSIHPWGKKVQGLLSPYLLTKLPVEKLHGS
ncbi:hypothetical protein ES703_114634 [subsurface metagenome]